MSKINVVRFWIHPRLNFAPGDLQKLVNIAYATARDRRLFPREILIRSGIHNTTKKNGQYGKDPLGAHLTLCYKDDSHVRNGTHVSSHGYVLSMKDWTYKYATHDSEKPDDTKKGSSKDAVWPSGPGALEELPSVAYSHLAEYVDDWIQYSQSGSAASSSQDHGQHLASRFTNLVGESSRATEPPNQRSISVDVYRDTYVEIEKEEDAKFKVRLGDNTSTRLHNAGWEEAYALYEEEWAPCYLYVGQKSGTRYWTWTLEPSKTKGKGKK